MAISRPFRGFPAALGCFSGLQGGYLNSSESKGSTRIDLRQKMWQPTPVVACFGLVSSVVCVLLAVAVPAVFLEGAIEWMVLDVLWRPTRTWGLYAHAKTT